MVITFNLRDFRLKISLLLFFCCSSIAMAQNDGDQYSFKRVATKRLGFWDSQKWMVGDTNGDGYDDLINVFNDDGLMSVDVHISNQKDGFYTTRWATKQLGFWDSQKWMVGDFDGDGYDDLVNVFNDEGEMSCDVHLSNGNGTGNGSFYAQRWATKRGAFWDKQKWMVGDVNGDGYDDLINVFNDEGEMSCDVHISNKKDGFYWQRWATKRTGFWDEMKFQIGDFNGDGYDDIVCTWGEDGKMNSTVHISNKKDGLYRQRWATDHLGFWYAQNWMVGDFNGDGWDDLMKTFPDAFETKINFHYSKKGESYFYPYNPSMKKIVETMTGEKWLVGKFTDKRKSQILRVWNDDGEMSADLVSIDNTPISMDGLHEIQEFNTEVDEKGKLQQGMFWYKQSKVLNASRLGRYVEEKLFDENKPTIIFVHGWSDKRDPFYYRTFKYAQDYLDRGYNVGYYRWDEFNNKEYGGFAHGAWGPDVGPFLSAVNRDGGHADTFRDSLIKDFSRGVSVTKRKVVKGSKLVKVFDEQIYPLSNYNKPIRLIGHSTGGQLITRAGYDDYLNKRKLSMVYLDPYFPINCRDEAKDYELGYYASRILKLGKEKKLPILWIGSSFIGKGAFSRLNNHLTFRNLHEAVSRVYLENGLRPAAKLTDLLVNSHGVSFCDVVGNIDYSVCTTYKDVPKEHQYLFEKHYIVSTAVQPGFQEIPHNYSPDWYFRTFIEGTTPWAAFTPGNSKGKHETPCGSSSDAVISRARAKVFIQSKGKYSFGVSDDEFYQKKSSWVW